MADEDLILQQFRDLLKSPVWARLSELGKAQIENRRSMILAPDHSKPTINGVEVSMEFLKGEISGINSFLALPDVLIETYALDKSNSQENVNDNGNEEGHF